MFYKSTKIIVIGSNVTRKAGPRVGSLGYISNMKYVGMSRVDEQSFLATYNTLIYFYKYGYEKRERLEKQAASLIIPIPVRDNNFNMLNKALAYVENKKEDKRRNYLVISPVLEKDALFGTANSFCAKIFSMLMQPYIKNYLTSICTNNDVVGGLYDISKLSSIINADVYMFILKLNKFMSDKNSVVKIKELILNTFFNNYKNFGNLVMLLKAIDVLEHRQNNSNIYEKKLELIRKKKENPNTVEEVVIQAPKFTFSNNNYTQSCQRLLTGLFKIGEFSKLIFNKGVNDVAERNISKFRDDLLATSKKINKG